MKKLVIYILFCLTPGIFPFNVSASSVPGGVDEGNKLYEQGKYDEAVEKYSEARNDSPGSDIANFNLGAALYKKGQYREAIEAFTRALNTEDREIEEKAVYNMANSKYQLGSGQAEKDLNTTVALYREALDYYKRAMEIDEDDRDAKYNHELVERQLKVLLDRLKNQPPGQQDKDQDQDKGDKKASQESGSDREKQGGEQQGQQRGQESDDRENESSGDREEAAGEEGTGTEGRAENSGEGAREMSPEEARMMLEVYGQEEGREGMKKRGRRLYKGVIRDW
jgi:Ca-activated chloride channel family protein